jgi:tetratricopeptide (TPR) repeat protein
MKEMSEIENSIERWNERSFQDYKEWLFKEINANQEPSVFLKLHIENFIEKYKSQIGVEINILLRKLFFIHLELKNYEESGKILKELIKQFGQERNLIKMEIENYEINPKVKDISIGYKKMILSDPNDNESIKKYIMYLKKEVDLNNKQSINDYIDYWNLYLEAFMNDPDAYNELSNVYLMVNEYDKAAFCLEELLLHNPNDYKILNKIGDIYTSKNNPEDARTAIKFYSRSIVINPTPKAFFGIQNCSTIISKKEKKLDEKTQKLVEISKQELAKMYENSPFKSFDVNKVFKA